MLHNNKLSTKTANRHKTSLNMKFVQKLLSLNVQRIVNVGSWLIKSVPVFSLIIQRNSRGMIDIQDKMIWSWTGWKYEKMRLKKERESNTKQESCLAIRRSELHCEWHCHAERAKETQWRHRSDVGHIAFFTPQPAFLTALRCASEQQNVCCLAE